MGKKRHVFSIEDNATMAVANAMILQACDWLLKGFYPQGKD